MTTRRRRLVQRATLLAIAGFWVLAAGHAVLTWPAGAVLVVLVGGAAAAMAVALAATRLGLQRFHVEMRVAGVPLRVALVRPASIYAAYRAAAIALGDGPAAAALATGLVVVTALGTDPEAVDAGLWSYPPSGLSALRYRDVPWWSFASRALVASGVSLAVQPFL